MKGEKIVKIEDWKNKVKKKMFVVQSKNKDEILEFAQRQRCDLNNVIGEIYAIYSFNNDGLFVVALSKDGVEFSGLSTIDYGKAELMNSKGEIFSLSDANMQYVASVNHGNIRNITNWENFYCNKFDAKKYDAQNAPEFVLDEYMKSRINIETITEGFVDDDAFDSCFFVGTSGQQVPQIMVFVGSNDGEHISSHFSLKVDDEMSPSEYEKMLKLLNLPALENFNS